MKEQLANMTIIELVRTAHSYAASIQTIETCSAIVTEMGSRLEALNIAHIAAMNNLRSATSTNDQLAAELKQSQIDAGCYKKGMEASNERLVEMAAECAAIKLMNDCLSEELRKYESDGAFEGPLMHLLWWKAETPATDRFLAEQRAQGVEMFARSLRGEAEITKACTFKPVHQFEEFAYRADECAAQLRNEVKV